MRKYAEYDEELILKLHEEGKSYNDIVKIIGCAKSTISYILGKSGNKKDMKDIMVDKNEVKRLLELGYTRKKIADEMDINESTVSKIVNGLGLKFEQKVVVKFNFTKEQVEEMLKTKSVKQIANENGVTVQTVYKKLK